MAAELVKLLALKEDDTGVRIEDDSDGVQVFDMEEKDLSERWVTCRADSFDIFIVLVVGLVFTCLRHDRNMIIIYILYEGIIIRDTQIN